MKRSALTRSLPESNVKAFLDVNMDVDPLSIIDLDALIDTYYRNRAPANDPKSLNSVEAEKARKNQGDNQTGGGGQPQATQHADARAGGDWHGWPALPQADS